ncbi:GPN-loop GTPase 2-like [Babylonia areolata]|uniref:GPN-loop GTPase 2-like n=1 Tax=Babylonia areolata TaxID=304850 RepID=UPI003FD56651
MHFGQVVIGPPGSGKTTYCAGMSQFLETLGRDVAVINLDPANDVLPYRCDVNIADLITVSDVMTHLKLGPNGGLIYCMEYLEKNLDWLRVKLAPLKDKYLIFDFPGQVELYTHHNSVRNIVQQLLTVDDHRLVAVHLVDSHYCSDPGKFISVLLTSLATMLQVELPHLNLLSKADLIEKYGKLSFGVDFYTEVLDLSYLLERLEVDPVFAKYKRLNEALVGLVEDYSLVSFTAVSVHNKEMMLRVKNAADKANGYVFGKEEERSMESLMSCAVGAEFQYQKVQHIQEKYVDTDTAVAMEDQDT